MASSGRITLAGPFGISAVVCNPQLAVWLEGRSNMIVHLGVRTVKEMPSKSLIYLLIYLVKNKTKLFLSFFYGYSYILMKFRSGFRCAFGAGSWPAKFSREIVTLCDRCVYLPRRLITAGNWESLEKLGKVAEFPPVGISRGN